MQRSKAFPGVILIAGVCAAVAVDAEEFAQPRAGGMQSVAMHEESAALRSNASRDDSSCGDAGKRVQQDIRGSIDGGRCGEAASELSH